MSAYTTARTCIKCTQISIFGVSVNFSLREWQSSETINQNFPFWKTQFCFSPHTNEVRDYDSLKMNVRQNREKIKQKERLQADLAKSPNYQTGSCRAVA